MFGEAGNLNAFHPALMVMQRPDYAGFSGEEITAAMRMATLRKRPIK